METWPNVKTALACKRELNFNPPEVLQRVCRNDANLERARNELLRPSRKFDGEPEGTLEEPGEAGGPSRAGKLVI